MTSSFSSLFNISHAPVSGHKQLINHRNFVGNPGARLIAPSKVLEYQGNSRFATVKMNATSNNGTGFSGGELPS